MSGKVRGVVHILGETQTFGSKGFRKREMVLEQDTGKFKNYIPLDFTRDACDEADELRVGDEIEVKYQLGGRKWQKDESSDARYFLSAEVTDFTILVESRRSSKPKRSSRRDEEPADDGETPF